MSVIWSYAGNEVGGYEDLLKRYSTKEFASPTRSTIPLLSYWRNPITRIDELKKVIKHSSSESIYLDFEHRVPTQRGKGNPSCTDLKLSFGSTSVYIEAKYKEPRYAEVGTWLNKSNTKNRHEVMTGWLQLLNKCSGEDLKISDVEALPYQLIHRAASACYGNVHNRLLVYQVFTESTAKRDMYISDLRSLSKLLGGGSKLEICLVECVIDPTDFWLDLQKKWKSGERDLSSEVFDGLMDNNFKHIHLKQITAV